MLKRKAEYDLKHKPTTASTSTSTSSSPSSSSTSSTSPTTSIKPNKKQKLSPADKAAHRDPSLYLNKQRTLVLSSRGITYRDRHLLSDLVDLLPHAKKDAKLDTKRELRVLDELALLASCNNVLFFECRKHKDVYLWLSKASTGPSIKCLVQNVHTMAEVKLTGNCMKHSRPLLVFDSAFDSQPHLQLLKALLHQCMASPKGHPKVKPFIDHVLSFFIVDQRVWIRHYQIIYDNQTNTEPAPAAAAAASSAPSPSLPASLPSNVQLVEIGPRLVLCPIRMFSGSFVGATLWENPDYVSPNALRAAVREARGREYSDRLDSTQRTRQHKKEARMQENDVDTVFNQPLEDDDD